MNVVGLNLNIQANYETITVAVVRLLEVFKFKLVLFRSQNRICKTCCFYCKMKIYVIQL